MARAYPVAVVLAALLAACSTPGPAAPTDDEWTAPAWFGQQAREAEERTTTLQACMDARGWHVTMNEFGGSSKAWADQDELHRFASDSDACRAELGIPTLGLHAPTDVQVRQSYRYMLDTWLCLRHGGYVLADPPSEDAWVESVIQSFSASGVGFWTPFADPAMDALPLAEWETAEQKCPQYRTPW